MSEADRIDEDARRVRNWTRWGPYLSERQWGTVREDYSADGNVWNQNLLQPQPVTILDYVNPANGKTTHVVQNGTATVGFVNGAGAIVLGTMTSQTQATVATWRTLPNDTAKLAYYPDHYHLAMRDLGRATVLGDIVAWMKDPAAPLPSGADEAARAWLKDQTAK